MIMKKFEFVEALKRKSAASTTTVHNNSDGVSNINVNEAGNGVHVAAAASTADRDGGVLDADQLREVFGATSTFNDVTLNVPESKYFDARGELQVDLLEMELEVSVCARNFDAAQFVNRTSTMPMKTNSPTFGVTRGSLEKSMAPAAAAARRRRVRPSQRCVTCVNVIRLTSFVARVIIKTQ
jgi:hypothetical protein